MNRSTTIASMFLDVLTPAEVANALADEATLALAEQAAAVEADWYARMCAAVAADEARVS